MQRHFDHLATSYYDFVDRIWYEFGYYHLREVEFLRIALQATHKVAIDAGCGPGRHSAVLASGVGRVLAVDISRKMLEVARDKVSSMFPGVVDFVQADVRSLPVKPGVADLVVNFEVLEHLANGKAGVLAAFQEFHRVLCDRGRLITELPLVPHRLFSALVAGSRKELSVEEKKSNYEDAPLPFANAYREGETDKLLRAAGFVALSKRYVRVIPAGLVERVADLGKVDSILEMIPMVRRLAREIIWLAET